MQKSLLFLAIFISSLFAQIITLENGWNLVGASEDINMSSFDKSKCVNFIWTYNNSHSSSPKWLLHVANGLTYNVPNTIGTLNNLKPGQGFWVFNNSMSKCEVNTTNSSSNANQTTTNINSNSIILGVTDYYTNQYTDYDIKNISNNNIVLKNIIKTTTTSESTITQNFKNATQHFTVPSKNIDCTIAFTADNLYPFTLQANNKYVDDDLFNGKDIDYSKTTCDLKKLFANTEDCSSKKTTEVLTEKQKYQFFLSDGTIIEKERTVNSSCGGS